VRPRHCDRNDVEVVVGDRGGDETELTTRAVDSGPEQPLRMAACKAWERDTALAGLEKPSLGQRKRCVVSDGSERCQFALKAGADRDAGRASYAGCGPS
jgi:hypothetical protein